MTTCKVMPARHFYYRYGRYVRDYMTKPGSEYQQKLHSWLSRETLPSDDDGAIALVFEDGGIIGWARTEKWKGYDTLEAFVMTRHRMRGIASFAAAGLKVRGLGQTVAVFHHHMVMVAIRAGLRSMLFERDDGRWVKVDR